MVDRAVLGGDWVLWRDFAVRSAGFPASGLSAFGCADESERLRAVARDPRFREAVTWQNPAALVNAVDKVAAGAPTKPSRARQREEIVASYWQRYCAKNDTIGFFGPLAWGRLADDGPPLSARCGDLVRERAVHLEAWAVQALAERIDPALKIATGPRAEDELHDALTAHRDAGVRERGLAALAQLVAARDAVAAAPREALLEALAALDSVFVELTGRDPVRNQGRAYGARTLAYVDCLRDLDVTVGADLIRDLAPALRVMFEAGRWYCGQVNAICRRVIERAAPADGRGPFIPVMAEVLRTLMSLPPELDGECAELQRRMAALLADPEPATVASRATALFADHRDAWSMAVFHSVDVQIAAADEAAVAAGDYLAVLGDVHAGNNPVMQGVFAHRHPDPAGLLDAAAAEIGPAVILLPPWGAGIGLDARGIAVTPRDWVHIAAVPEGRAFGGRRTWWAHELLVDGTDVVDRDGTLRVSLFDVFAMPIFITAVRTFELLAPREHAPRATIGRTVLGRESWSVPATAVPQRAEDVAAFARDRGMPRRVFAKSPLERKPMYLDTHSPVLGRILCRLARQAVAESADAHMSFTEMLPTPEQSWLSDAAGEHFVCELRLVGVDVTRSQRL